MTIITDSFGNASDDLLNGHASKHFAKLFLYSARRPSLSDDNEPFSCWDEEYNWPDLRYGPSGPRGDDLLDFACWRLSELKACLESINYRKIKAITEEQAKSFVQAISEVCACPACGREQVDVNRFTCLIGVTGAIIRFVGLLSKGAVATTLTRQAIN